MTADRRYRAGDSLEDHCRACHEDRTHAVFAVDTEGRPLRVTCAFCGSQHNYRGGPRMTTPEAAAAIRHRLDPSAHAESVATREPADRSSEPARANPSPPPPTRSTLPMTTPSTSSDGDLERLLRRVIREESGLTPVAPAERWRGGELVLRPGRPGVQEKSWPIDGFFHKIVMIRNRLRTLEQQVNASDLPDDQKVKLQAYVTACYGSLTSFNVLFADDEDRFVGSAND